MAVSGRQIRKYVFAAAAVVLLLFLFGSRDQTIVSVSQYATEHNYHLPSRPSIFQITTGEKYAYCVFLAEPNETIQEGEEDYYFTGTRMLIYQLLHDPETRTNNSIPLVVLVAEGVPEWKRETLRQDGAIVKSVAPIKIDWIQPGKARWASVMDKLHVFELIEYDKILLVDTDVVVTQNMDGVFADPATILADNMGMMEQMKDDESPQPQQYIMAGNCGPSSRVLKYPSRLERGDRLNAGFVVFKPSLEMFEHYMSVAAIERRFPGAAPEQDLWNYVHRRDGNMPWTQLDPHWTINSPIYEDYVQGIASFHEKYWKCDRDKKLKDLLLRIRWKMEGFTTTMQATG